MFPKFLVLECICKLSCMSSTSVHQNLHIIFWGFLNFGFIKMWIGIQLESLSDNGSENYMKICFLLKWHFWATETLGLLRFANWNWAVLWYTNVEKSRKELEIVCTFLAPHIAPTRQRSIPQIPQWLKGTRDTSKIHMSEGTHIPWKCYLNFKMFTVFTVYLYYYYYYWCIGIMPPDHELLL